MQRFYFGASTSWTLEQLFLSYIEHKINKFAELLGSQFHPGMPKLAPCTSECKRTQGFKGPLGSARPGAVAQLLEGCQLAGLLMSGVVSGK